MLSLFGTGLLISVGFVLQHGLLNEETTPVPSECHSNAVLQHSFLEPPAVIISILFPLLINAWFSAYLFCYWYNHLLCLNIDYLEKLISSKVMGNDELPTWYHGKSFFTIFNDFKCGRIYLVWVLFSFIGLPLMALYFIIFFNILTLFPTLIVNIVIRFIPYVFYWLIPLGILSIHIMCTIREDEKIRGIYEEAGLKYDNKM